jgi:hypothetical protein
LPGKNKSNRAIFLQSIGRCLVSSAAVKSRVVQFMAIGNQAMEGGGSVHAPASISVHRSVNQQFCRRSFHS